MPAKEGVRVRNLAKIKSALLHPATTSHFEVILGLPSTSIPLKKFLSGDSQDNLNLMCSEAVLPGSQLATTEVTNDFTGATERHAYRRIYDETIDLTFYVDAGNYLPIMFFETWMNGIVNEDQNDARSGNYNYRIKYPDEYVATGLKVRKFERTGNPSDLRKADVDTNNAKYGGSLLEYEFVRSYPRSITSMPVSYDGSSLLKCSVQMTYLRYVVNHYPRSSAMRKSPAFSQVDLSAINNRGFLDIGSASALTDLTNQIINDVNTATSDRFAGNWTTSIELGLGANDLRRSIQSGLT